MPGISLKPATNNLGSYDLICVWDISTSDSTCRTMYDCLQPCISEKVMDYESSLNWIRDNFIYPEDRKIFEANLDLEVLEKLKDDYHFSVRTKFPDGIIRQFAYVLSPSIVAGDDHVYFAIFDLENDSEEIRSNPINAVLPPTMAFKTIKFVGQSFKYVYALAGLGALVAGISVLGYLPYAIGFVALLAMGAGLIYLANRVKSSYETAEQDIFRRHDASVVQAMKSLSKVISAEKDVDRARSVFMGCVSRDFRTPMNSIVGMTALARKNIADHEYVRSCLDKISSENNSIINLIDNILDISELDSGKMQVNHNVFSLSELTTSVADCIAVDSLEKKIAFDVRVHNIRYEYLNGDETKLKTILTNLVTNAVKYTPAGGSVTMDVSEEILTDKKGSVKLTVVIEDNGVGIPKEYRRDMYSAFSQAVDNKVKRIKGSGLGLALCKRLVDLMDGTMTCESEEKVGTKFTVSLDLPFSGLSTDEMTLSRVRYLVVDDDRPTLDCAVSTVHEMGGIIDVALSNEEALKILSTKQQKYDMIVVDWHNKDIEPVQGIRNIRKLVGNDTPILVSSPFSMHYIEEESRLADINGFAQKPCFKSTVYTEIIKYMYAPKESEPKLTEDTSAVSLEGMHVLVAEDNDLNWEIIAELLETVGIQSTRAENGLICIDKLFTGKEKFDAVLMDVQMPVLDGITATREIRKFDDPEVRNIPIIAMTADSFTENVKQCIEAGMNSHITKPVDLDKLFADLRKFRKPQGK